MSSGLETSNSNPSRRIVSIRMPRCSSPRPLTVKRSVDTISSSNVNITLSGYELTPPDSTTPKEITVEISANTPGTAPLQATVSQSQQFVVDADLQSLVFDTVTGVFGTVGTTLEPTQHDIDVPQGFETAELVTALLTLQIENGVQLPGALDLTLQGNNGKTMNLAGLIAPASSTTSALTVLVDSTVADFLSPLPSQITISGSANFGAALMCQGQ